MTSTSMPAGLGDAGPGEEAIAIIGLACRVPGAGDSTEFWRNLAGGVESLQVCTLEEQAALGVPEHWLNDPYFVPVSAGLDDVAGLDAAFFGLSAPEAEIRDPQHRLFLELAYTALEDSGYDPARYPGEIGVYAGSGEDAYQWLNTRRNPRAFAASGPLGLAISSHSDYVATFASFKLNLRGPSLTVHTACSSSMVAIHLACEALRNGECDIALGGGVNIDLPLGWGYMYFDGAIYSPDGHTRTFDAGAAGTIWSDGGGVIVLKRLADALADGDHVRAVILGNAINNDGRAKVGFTAPSQEGQATVIAQALATAAVNPRTISYVEAHGTATAVGDPIEIAALSSVYQRYSADTGWCAIGSVKTNIGHLGAAAGVAGVIKTVLALEHELIPPSLNYESPNPKISFTDSAFQIAADATRWARGPVPRRAGVSAFGVGGTNAHLILEEAPVVARDRTGSRPAQLIMLSARTSTALTSAGQRLAARLADEQTALDLADVAGTLRVGRRELPHRLAVVATSPADAAAALASSRRRIAAVATPAPPKVAFLFSGQGSQYPGMGRELYGAEPAFRDAAGECFGELPGRLGDELRELMFAASGEPASTRLQQTEVAQPALFVLEYALARLWQSWGVEPAAMAGHSIGEYVAATLAGVFSLADALRVVAARGRLMQQLAAGAMLAVQSGEAGLRARLPDLLSVAAVNGPRSCVVSGPEAEVTRFASQLDHEGVGSRRLRTSHAFHSRMMEPALAAFREVVAGVALQPPRRDFLSDVTGDWITPAEATDPSYWARHLRETVRFGDCLTTLLGEDAWLLVECGPGRQLCGLAGPAQRGDRVAAVPSLPGPGDRKGDAEVIYAAAGRLWASGVALDERGFGDPGYRVPLPGYPWERQPYWIKPQPGGSAIDAPPDLRSGGPRPVDEWFAVPTWRQLPPPGPAGEPVSRCLVFADRDAASGAVSTALGAAGVWQQAVLVRPGEAFGRDAAGGYTVRPGMREDYDALVADLGPGGVPSRIVHAWALDTPPAQDATATWQALDSTFFSLLALVQAVAQAGPDSPVHLDVLTAGTADVTGPDLVRPEHAVVAGIARVAPLELPWLSVRHVDLDPGQVPGGAPRAAARLAAELLTPPGGAAGEVALRGGRRWRREYEQVTVPADQEGRLPGPGLRDGGVYVITGGLGGIGITLAETLATGVRARLALVSRSGLPPRAEWDGFTALHGAGGRAGRAMAAIARMEDAGAEVLVLAADVATAEGAQQVRAAVLERFGRVDGIVHAAGVPGGGMAEVKERGAAEQVLAPKVAGTLALRAAFGHLDLDFVVLCSSTTAVAGGFGQVDYCAANSFLDAHARSAHGWKAPVISVNWGGWREVGMAAEVAAPAAFRALQRGDRMSPVRHPVLTGRHETDDGTPGWCGGVVSPASHWVLGEHRLAGVPVLPGTAYLELVRCAFAVVAPAPGAGQLTELRDVAFTEPMAVPDGDSAEIRVIFAPGSDGLDFQVASLTRGSTRIHARGSVTWTSDDAERTGDLAAIRQRCSLAVRTGEPDPSFSSGLVTFGSRWGNVRRTHVGHHEQLTLLEANQTAAAELDRWVLHPALLDEATAAGAAESDQIYLPLGYGSVTVHRPLTARFWSHLRRQESATSEVVTCDLTLFDETGRILTSITDFTMRRVDQGAMTAALTAKTADGRPGTHAALADGSRESVTGAESAAGIRPADGAEAFRRLAGADLGPQVVIAVQPIGEIMTAARQVTHTVVEGGPAAAAEAPGGDGQPGDGQVAPRTELESVIARLWAEVLGSGQVGVTDNFFASGGNSLVAVQIISLIRKELGVRLSMRKLFEDPTVAGVAQQVAALKPGRG
jgi:phthiocerol/phenolphthiocerol synthesis type-I polyketide synthase E